MTDKEREFYIHKATGERISDKPKASPTHGVLLYDNHIISNPMPYALLQHKKKELINQGYLPSKLKIRKHY